VESHRRFNPAAAVEPIYATSDAGGSLPKPSPQSIIRRGET
jgi:hypothetical protein